MPSRGAFMIFICFPPLDSAGLEASGQELVGRLLLPTEPITREVTNAKQKLTRVHYPL